METNTGVLIEVVNRYSLDLKCEYEKTGNRIFAVSAYEDCVLRKPDFDGRDFKRIPTNRKPRYTNSRIKYYESSDEILQICLNENQPCKL